MSVLPPRPLRLHQSFVGRTTKSVVILGVIFAGFGVGLFLWQLGDFSRFLRDRDIWATGATATAVSVKGEAHFTTPVITLGLVKFYDYDLKVAYSDGKGEARTATLKVESMLVGIDQSAEPVVKFDPASPDRFVLSWAIDLGLWRWSWLGFKWILILACGTLLVLVLRGATRVLRNARLAAENSDEVLLEVEKIEPFLVNGAHHGQFIVHYLLPGGGAPTSRNVAMHPPLLLEKQGKQYLVSLAPEKAPGKPVILEENLMPFAFTPDEEAAIRRNL